MRITFKNRIISGITVLSLMLSAFAPVYTVHGEGEQEASLYEVMATATDAAEVTLLSSSEESEVEIAPATETDAEIATEEGLEVVEKYIISEREEDSDETLWVKVEQDEKFELQPEESMSIYTVSEDKLDDVVIEDIAEEEEPCEIANDTTSLALVKDSGYRHMNIELDSVTLDGMMPKDATAEAVDVTAEFSAENEATETDGIASEMYATETDVYATATDALYESSTTDTIAAFDITIKNGEEEYQPSEERPIMVSIADPAITSDAGIRIFHIKDNGEREEITDFSLEEGKVSFSAVGFSVYQIVNDAISGYSESGEYITTLAELDGQEVYIGNNRFGATYYLTKVTNGKIASTLTKNNAVKYHFTKVEGSEDKFNIWYYDDNNQKMYLAAKPDRNQNFYQFNSTSDSAYVYEFTVQKSNWENWFYLSSVTDKNPDDKQNHWLFNNSNKNVYRERGFVNGDWDAGANNGKGAVVSRDKDSDAEKKAHFFFGLETEMQDDPYGLDGKTYGLMYYSAGGVGNAFMADKNKDYQSLVDLIVRDDNGSNNYYVSEKSDVTMWTFSNVTKDNYILSADVDGVTKYLKMDSSGLDLVDSVDDATAITVTAGYGANEGQITLAANGFTLIYNNNAGFIASSSSTNNSWLSFIEKIDLPDDSNVAYSARKIGVSEATNGQKVVVYTRVWNGDTSSYDYYAVDHQGKLVRCYERGDDIMWVDNQINTLEWTFTEHYWEGTNNPNDYYDLYNSYSKKYLAPQTGSTELLSDSPIGLNLPGRADGEYYTDIIAWDKKHYTYAGVKADVAENKIVSTKRKDAVTFYFATLDPVKPTLTTVETIKNSDYGITMKMADFTAGRNAMSNIIGNNDEAYKPGLLSTDLKENGYPQCTLGDKNSLYELYKNETTVDRLFIASTYEATGYFEFDSCQNFATLLNERGQRTNEFTVYKELGTTDNGNKTTLKHGQFFPYNQITPGNYAITNPTNLYSALADYRTGYEAVGLLPDDDPRKYEKLHLVSSPNYQNAMELEASFVQTANGLDAWGHPIIFEFTGDDDFWLYVDGELVIDLGGIHSALAGSVNFATGDVVVNKEPTTLREIFKSNYKTRNPEASDEAVNNYLAQYFNEGSTVFKNYSSHTMKVFYNERGSGASNLHMRFNLSYVEPQSAVLRKEVDGTNKMDFDQVEYAYQIYYRDRESADDHEEGNLLNLNDDNVSVTYQNSTKPVKFVEHGYKPVGYDGPALDNVFLITPKRGVEIHFPNNTFDYRIVELSVNDGIYNDVYINPDTDPIEPIVTKTGEDDEEGGGTEGESNEEPNRYNYDTGWQSVDQTSHITFHNKVDESGLRTLRIKKELYDFGGKEEGRLLTEDEDPTVFGFRLYLSNGVDEELELASMTKYRVIDEKGFYCYWDASKGRFQPTEFKSFVAIPDTLVEGETGHTKDDCTFETSMNGTISEIPAAYTIEVPILPVDMKFMLEERTWEVPLGYQLIEYAKTNLDDDEENISVEPISGIIESKESNPQIIVRNKKGWEIEVTKKWSDSEFVEAHDSICLAAYCGDELIEGTVKRLNNSDKTLRFFFDELKPGTTFADYTIKEVTVDNKTVPHDLDENNPDKTTVISPGTVTPVGPFVQIDAKVNGSSEFKPYWYSVDYDLGVPYGVNDENNIREDTIENIRGGGIVLSLYEWGSQELTDKTALPGGEFTLTENGVEVGTFTSDEKGRITILYDFDRDAEYVLTETKTPEGFIGLPYPVTFVVGGDDEITWTNTEPGWVICHKADLDQGDEVHEKEIVAFVDVYNKPFELRVLKVDNVTKRGLGGAHFALYKGVSNSIGELIKDFTPLPGYEDIVSSGVGGILEEVNSTLEPGKYFLTETEAPMGYEFDKDQNDKATDIVFIIHEDRHVEYISGGADVTHEQLDEGDKVIYKISVPNKKQGTEKYLTITKTVDGNLGNKAKDFTFTFTATNVAADKEFTWMKNGEEQSDKLSSGDTFTMGHNDTVIIEFDTEDVNVTISEVRENYDATFQIEGETKTVINAPISFTVSEDTTLYVTNTLDSDIPKIALTVTKIDQATANALSGVTLKLSRLDKNNNAWQPVSQNGVTDAYGKWTTSDVSQIFKGDGFTPGTYMLEETDTPDGYNSIAGPLVFVISAAGKVTKAAIGSYDESSVVAYSLSDITEGGTWEDKNFKISNPADGKAGEIKLDITNAAYTDLQVTKKDPDGNPISGAEFMLEYQASDNSWKKIKLSDGKAVTANHVLTEGNDNSAKMSTASGGLVKFKGLPDGDYRLTETKTTQGYNLLSAPIEIHIDRNGMTYNALYGDAQTVALSMEDGTNTLKMTVVNKKGSALPKTGKTTPNLPKPVLPLVAFIETLMLYLYGRRRRKKGVNEHD